MSAVFNGRNSRSDFIGLNAKVIGKEWNFKGMGGNYCNIKSGNNPEF
jgi:hypothetical protein